MSINMSASAPNPRGTLYISGKTLTGISVFRVIKLENPQQAKTFFLSHRDGGKYTLLGGEYLFKIIKKTALYLKRRAITEIAFSRGRMNQGIDEGFFLES